VAEAAARFASYGEADWRRAAEAALKGAGFATLVSRAADGIELQPLYPRRQGPRALRRDASWRVLARLDHPDPAAANDQALDDLANGADGLQVVFAGAAGAYGFGLAKADSSTLHRAFEGVRFAAEQRFELDLGPNAEAQATGFAALVARSGVAPRSVDLAFGLDPIGALARSGRAARPWSAEAAALAKVASFLAAQGFAGPYLAADARAVHAAGGTPAQELGFAIAAAVAYLRALADGGFSREAAAAAIGFRLAADADEFFTLAKFRALRLMWGRVRSACGLDAAPARVHGESAWRTMTARDPYVNVMRGAAAAFAAGLGGADSVSVLPHTQALGLPDALARRLARNAQLILLEESHLGFVADPAAGAGVFEALTATLCEKGWTVFQALERAGGAPLALRAGVFQGEVAEAAARIADDAARLKALITGVSAHVNLADLAEAPVDVAPATPAAFDFAGEAFAAPLTALRLAEPFERLREISDAAQNRDGARPRTFLAAIGPFSKHGRRVGFARDLLETGGFDTAADPGGDDPSAAAARFKASGAAVACLCGDDESYAARGHAFARALKAAGARWLALAGRPGDAANAWRDAGIDDFLFVGADAVAALRRAWAQVAAAA
jgi:methylmalonyl-CoA mutase